jgi:MipA family protein
MRLLGILLNSSVSFSTLLSISVYAQEGKPNLPLWELGGFGVVTSQQAYPGSDQQVNRGLALPYFVYRGEFLRADRDTAGLRAIKTPLYEFDVSVAGAFGAGSNELNARKGMPKLGTLVEFGPRLRLNLSDAKSNPRWGLDLPVRGVFDLSDSLKHRGLKAEPTLTLRGSTEGNWRYSLGAGVLLADRKLSDTLYGVAPIYATANRASYQAGSGLLAWRLSGSVAKQLTHDWRVFAFTRFDSVSGAKNENSPLVKQKNGATVGLGLSYTWLRSSSSAAD